MKEINKVTIRNTVKLPQSQKDIIVKSLQVYQSVLRTLKDKTDDQEYTVFDITCLTGIFSDKLIDVKIELDEEVLSTFVHRHGVDFPQYN